MSIRFNHTIVHSRNEVESARFLSEIRGLPAPVTFGPLLVVELENGASLDFIDVATVSVPALVRGARRRPGAPSRV